MIQTGYCAFTFKLILNGKIFIARKTKLVLFLNETVFNILCHVNILWLQKVMKVTYMLTV